MQWYDYLYCFLGGVFTANFFPHFIRGVTGAQFPTPFAKPPGRGMSSALVNVLWALLNIVVGYAFLWAAGFSRLDIPSLVTAFVGFALMSILLGRTFSQRVGT